MSSSNTLPVSIDFLLQFLFICCRTVCSPLLFVFWLIVFSLLVKVKVYSIQSVNTGFFCQQIYTRKLLRRAKVKDLRKMAWSCVFPYISLPLPSLPSSLSSVASYIPSPHPLSPFLFPSSWPLLSPNSSPTLPPSQPTKPWIDVLEK